MLPPQPDTTGRAERVYVAGVGDGDRLEMRETDADMAALLKADMVVFVGTERIAVEAIAAEALELPIEYVATESIVSGSA